MDVSTELADRVLRLVGSTDYRPMKPKQIAAALGASPDEFREVKRVIKWLAHRGQLVYGANHLVMREVSGPPASTSTKAKPPRQKQISLDPDQQAEQNLRDQQAETFSDGIVRGTFFSAMGGFGFVRRSDSQQGSEPLDDVFVPPGATGGAINGDLVELRLYPRSQRRGDEPEGEVEKILERGRRQFTGTFEMRGSDAVVHLDGVPYRHPLAVGDVRGLPVENDDKVFVEIVRFPLGLDRGEAVILEVLGKTTNPAIDTLSIMRQFGLPESFSEDVLNDARGRADAFVEGEIAEGRRDLTSLLTITIDPADARDFDDAISLQKDGPHWTLWVHIADVSHFVPVGSPVDQEAQRRATSVYLPDRVIPMIPEVISNHLASLQPERARLTKTVEIHIREDGVVTAAEVYNAMIRSDRRFSYEQIDQFLESPAEFREPWGNEVCELLQRMHTLAMDMRRRRFRLGSLTLDVPEVKIDLDKGGKVKGAHLVAYTESHQIIEEFMLAANQAVATWLDDLGLNHLHRVHPSPERRKLRQLEMFVKDLRLPIKTVESRQDIQRVLDVVAGTPLENAVNLSVLRSMNKAVYSPNAEGHYALNMDHYCHFTSPIRRYPDLTTHRLVQNLLDRNKTPDEAYAVLLQLGFHCSDQERNAAQAERELVQLKLLHFMKKQLGQTIRVMVSRVYADGILARGIEFPIEGYLPVTSLPPDRYRFERRGQMLVGFKAGHQVRLGDELSVKVAKVDLRERQLIYDFVSNHTVGRSDPFAPAAEKAVRNGTGKKDKTKKEKRKIKKRGK